MRGSSGNLQGRLETPLRLDDGFAEAGGHSILIARLAQKLQAAGWVVSVRALLSDCNTARKVANCPRALQQTSKASTVPVKSDESSAERDEPASEVLSVRYFTILQVLFATLLYFPGLAAFFAAFGIIDVEAYFATGSLWAFIVAGFVLFLVGLVAPFVSLLWVMMIKFYLGGDIYKNNVTPGVYPEVEQDASANLVHRKAGERGAPPVGCDVSQRAAYGIRIAAARRDSGQKPPLRT